MTINLTEAQQQALIVAIIIADDEIRRALNRKNITGKYACEIAEHRYQLQIIKSRIATHWSDKTN